MEKIPKLKDPIKRAGIIFLCLGSKASLGNIVRQCLNKIKQTAFDPGAGFRITATPFRWLTCHRECFNGVKEGTDTSLT